MKRKAQIAPASMPANLLLLLLFGVRVLAICPPMCTCSRGHRVVDCSARGLAILPESLQHNIHFLNLSYNRIQNLDGLLKHFDHLRTLDISYNHLHHLPVGLPRALWDIRASGNYIRQLEKNDTAYHWNLQNLDLSFNLLERAVLINNTLSNLQSLNLSHNKFWTVPTNMPYNLEMVDLSHNYLLQILPGSLDRLPRLKRFYLHANRFTSLSKDIFNQLDDLQLLTLGDNPWACEDEENINHLLTWMQKTPAKVLGCPCYTRPTCGEVHLATRRTWHSAAFTEQPLGADARHPGHRVPLHAVTSGYLSKSAQLNVALNANAMNTSEAGEQVLILGGGFRTSTPHSLSTQSSTTIRTRSTKKAHPGKAQSTSHQIHKRSFETTIWSLLCTVVILRAL
ncbi:oligodendrocyte-myelin glycoprotein [Danio rerio]|uniref:Oligodendrocyte myelin glycoprotein b n=1 Tax=Danio rerio TaxID=7955 RepID=E7FDN5_DANRE|nr:oligodendrocyte-myelin glycoprotein [Danio rerio]|eukprot:XP_005157765.1 oligodendrocyte-myelin glycoprotein [Danio rerio]